MAKPATNVPNERSVDDVIAALDAEQTAADSRVLVEIMRRVSGHATSQVPVLEEILRQSYANVKSPDGQMKRAE